MIMTRREARESCLKVLFAFGYTPEKSLNEIALDYLRDFEGEEDAYSRALLEAMSVHGGEVDLLIEACAVGWAMNRISRISMAILRLAVCEMLYMPKVPTLVSINEAIELSKQYDDEKAYSFVNGVLNRAAKSEAVLSVVRDGAQNA